jgi:hypothetical protein
MTWCASRAADAATSASSRSLEAAAPRVGRAVVPQRSETPTTDVSACTIRAAATMSRRRPLNATNTLQARK